MSRSSQELEQLWDVFLQRWPLESLANMTLPEYTAPATDDSFCYWLEARTEELGSIWGGSAFKFGVYARKDKSDKDDVGGRRYNGSYGWMAKYGGTAEEAFVSVRDEIVKIANAAHTGDIDTVYKANLGEAIRLKLAFLYQNRRHITLLPIYTRGMLYALLERKNISPPEAHRHLLAEMETRPLFDYARQLWETAHQTMSSSMSIDDARSYFEQSDDFTAIKPATKKIAGYEHREGHQLALSVDNKSVVLYLQAGDWLSRLGGVTDKVKEYAPDTPRNSNLAANAPALNVGNAIVCLTIDSLNTLQAVCDVYGEVGPAPALPAGEDSSVPHGELRETGQSDMTFPLNRILYGPPGTGKTYHSIELAVQAADPAWYQTECSHLSGIARRQKIHGYYKFLVEKKRIQFTTFHQSFSYEDFVEGIRADTDKNSGQIRYEITDGIFKKIAQEASSVVADGGKIGLSDNPNIWKISIGEKHETELRRRYLDRGEARIGWNDVGDLNRDYDARSPGEKDYWNSLSASTQGTIRYFNEGVAIGDVLLCLKDQKTVQAIGIVAGDYYYAPEEDGYPHARKVNWVLKDLDFNILNLNNNKVLVQKTVYALGRITWDDIIAELSQQGIPLPAWLSGTTEPARKPNYVLIIDEINRGNISRIFGELITLIEPSKRKGESDEVAATLPYSKEAFYVPANLYLIGTMNTADKSLVQLDLALRRRFAFIERSPDPSLLRGCRVYGVDLADMLLLINQRIEALLDAEHTIGHAYFMPLIAAMNDEARQALLAHLFRDKIVPLLREYFFDDYERIGWVLNDGGKKPTDRFVQLAGLAGMKPLEQLFPEAVASQIMDRRYRINEEAFTSAAAFQGILSNAAGL